LDNKIKKSSSCIAGAKKFNITPYLLILPMTLLFVAFTYYPFAKAIFLSFSVTKRSGDFAKWVGFSNWIRIFSKTEFWQIVWVTLKFALINLVFTLGIAMFFALLSATRVPGGKAYQMLFSLPMAIASAPTAAIWTFLFKQQGGILNWILGTSYAWTQETSTALMACAIVNIWMNIGASFIFLLVGFRNVPDELMESATIDGASPLRKVFSIQIPMASPQIFFVVFLSIITSFTAFAPIRLLTNGGPANSTTTLIYSVYKNAIINGRFETACVYSMALFLLIFIVTRIQFYFENRMVHYQ
jgi:sn-glycerol 3-phosphate transport system permease protein